MSDLFSIDLFIPNNGTTLIPTLTDCSGFEIPIQDKTTELVEDQVRETYFFRRKDIKYTYIESIDDITEPDLHYVICQQPVTTEQSVDKLIDNLSFLEHKLIINELIIVYSLDRSIENVYNKCKEAFDVREITINCLREGTDLSDFKFDFDYNLECIRQGSLYCKNKTQLTNLKKIIIYNSYVTINPDMLHVLLFPKVLWAYSHQIQEMIELCEKENLTFSNIEEVLCLDGKVSLKQVRKIFTNIRTICTNLDMDCDTSDLEITQVAGGYKYTRKFGKISCVGGLSNNKLAKLIQVTNHIKIQHYIVTSIAGDNPFVLELKQVEKPKNKSGRSFTRR